MSKRGNNLSSIKQPSRFTGKNNWNTIIEVKHIFTLKTRLGITAIVEELPNGNFYLTITGLDKRTIYSSVIKDSKGNPLHNVDFIDYIYDIIENSTEVQSQRKQYHK